MNVCRGFAAWSGPGEVGDHVAGPDVAIAASLAPTTKVTTVDGGYRVSGQHSSFATGVDHSLWVIVGGLVHKEPGPEWMLFLIPPGEYTVRDTWSVAGMRATGSNTIVTDDVFVPSSRVLRLSDLRDGTGPGGALHDDVIFHMPLFYFAPLTFVAPMLGEGSLRTRPRMDKDAQDNRWRFGRSKNQHPGAHGPGCG